MNLVTLGQSGTGTRGSQFLPYPTQLSPWSVSAPVLAPLQANVAREEAITRMPTRVQAKAAVIDWVRDTFPDLYAAAVERAGLHQKVNSVDGLGLGQGGTAYEWVNGGTSFTSPTQQAVQTEESTFDKIISGISNFATTYLQYETQKDILDMQLDRASAGLPPLNTEQFAPTIKVQAGVDPATAQQIIDAGTQELRFMGRTVTQWIPWIIGGVAVLWILK